MHAQLLSQLFATPWTVWSLPHSSVCGISQARMLECCYFLLQGVFLTQGSKLHLLNWQIDCLPLGHLGHYYSSHNPKSTNATFIFFIHATEVPYWMCNDSSYLSLKTYIFSVKEVWCGLYPETEFSNFRAHQKAWRIC